MAEIDCRLAGIDCFSASRLVVEEHQAAPRRYAPHHASANAVRNLRTIRAAVGSTSPAAAQCQLVAGFPPAPRIRGGIRRTDALLIGPRDRYIQNAHGATGPERDEFRESQMSAAELLGVHTEGVVCQCNWTAQLHP
jgi:hypothetical protein